VITKAQVKDIRALATSKGRHEQNAFLIEGNKLAKEWLSAEKPITYIIALDDWLKQNHSLMLRHPEAQVLSVTENELARVSTHQSPNDALVVAPIPASPGQLPFNEWCLVLDTVQDPGNLGTIIRIADWFGIDHVLCSPGCADFYNPKVVAAAMGGHLRVQLHIASLPDFLAQCNMPVLAATLHGRALQEIKPLPRAALIIGNESKGISEEVLRFATQQVTIARRGGAESLNAAVSAGILLSALLPA
jgi:TrmH family RNA methyltransferase